MEIQEIKNQLTIEQVLAYYSIAIKNNLAYCPYHQTGTEKKRSLQVNTKSNTVYCYSTKCKYGAKQIDVIDFIMYQENCTKHEAIIYAEQLLTEGFISSVKTARHVEQSETSPTENKDIKALTEEKASQTNERKLDILYLNRIAYITELINYFVLGGIPKSYDTMKITLEASLRHPELDSGSNKHKCRTKLDLYEYKQIEKTASELAEKLNIDKVIIENDLYILANLLEKHREQTDSEGITDTKISKIILSEKDITEIKKFLKQKNLLEQLTKLIASTGIVGEENNIKCLLVVGLSIKLSKTLHALVQGSSGSGKTLLIKKIVDCFPEDRVKEWTRISDKVLYNMPRDFFKGMLILIEDTDGLSEEALYALRELMSSGRLISLASIKNKQGNHDGGEHEVRGPMASFAATTKGEIYEDNMSRVITLAVDESEAQTDRIIEYQNKKSTGEIKETEEEKNRDFTRKLIFYLKEYEVINPYANKIHLPKHLQKRRRLNELFQSFIKIITLLHQEQREKVRHPEQSEGTLISTIEDIENAIAVLFESIIIKADELDGSLRQFYEKLKTYIEKGSKYNSRDREFTQREIRQKFNLSKASCSRYFNTLLDLEYITSSNNKNLRKISYKIDHWDNYTKLREDIKTDLQSQLELLKLEQ